LVQIEDVCDQIDLPDGFVGNIASYTSQVARTLSISHAPVNFVTGLLGLFVLNTATGHPLILTIREVIRHQAPKFA
jgi:hypothetical protein